MANMNGMVALEPPVIVAKTTSYTVKSKESGTIFTNVGATLAVVFTLPPISEGPWHFTFVGCVDFALTVTAAAVDHDQFIGDNAVNNDSIAIDLTGARIGGSIEVFCDGTSLFSTGVSSVALIGTG